jgi:hypothetical protein
MAELVRAEPLGGCGACGKPIPLTKNQVAIDPVDVSSALEMGVELLPFSKSK